MCSPAINLVIIKPVRNNLSRISCRCLMNSSILVVHGKIILLNTKTRKEERRPRHPMQPQKMCSLLLQFGREMMVCFWCTECRYFPYIFTYFWKYHLIFNSLRSIYIFLGQPQISRINAQFHCRQCCTLFALFNVFVYCIKCSFLLHDLLAYFLSFFFYYCEWFLLHLNGDNDDASCGCFLRSFVRI